MNKSIHFYTVIKCISKKYLDKEICLEAVKNKGLVLQYVPKEIIDKQICLEAVKNEGYSLKFVPEEFKDKEICLEAVKNSIFESFLYIPKKYLDKKCA